MHLTEQVKKLTVKVEGRKKQISNLADKVMEQSNTIERLQERMSDLGRLDRHLGREQAQSIGKTVKGAGTGRKGKETPKRAFEMSR